LTVLILWMNMATSATLSFGLAFEAGEKNIMKRPPRDPKLHVMDGFAIWRVIFVGSMIAVSAFVLEAWLQPRGYSPEFIRTVLLQTLVTAQWFYMLNCRVADGFSLSKGLTGEQRHLDRQRRSAGAAAADYLRAVYANAVWHRAAVPLLGDHFCHRLCDVPDCGGRKTVNPNGAPPEARYMAKTAYQWPSGPFDTPLINSSGARW
jgi:hypothetical protein